jgi:hypothetical protein
LLAAVPLAVVPAAAQPAGDVGASQSADARAASRKFAEGERAFRSGDVTRAAEAFEAAYALAPHPDALWNAARAWHRAGEIARAANLYAKFLREAPASAPDRNSATTNLVQLSSRLGRLEIHASSVADVRVDDRAIEGTIVYVHPGQHIVRARRGDQPLEETQTVRAGEVVSVAFAPPPSAPAALTAPAPPSSPALEAPAGATPRPAAPAPALTPAPATAERARSGWSPVVVWLGAGLSVAAGAVTAWSGFDTLSERDAFLSSPSQGELDSGRDKQLRTNVALGITGGLAALTAVTALFLVDWHGAGARGQVGLGPGSVGMRGSF